MQFLDVNHDSKSILISTKAFSVCLEVQPNYQMDLTIQCTSNFSCYFCCKIPGNQKPKAFTDAMGSFFFKCMYKDEVNLIDLYPWRLVKL